MERRPDEPVVNDGAAGDNYKAWYDEAVGAANEAGYGPCSAADAIRGLAAEVAHYRQIAEEGTTPLIKSMKLEDGQFDLAVTGPIVEAISCAFVGQFKECGSTNYMEMSLTDRDEPFQRYTVTVQKVGAKSPADLVNEERALVANLRGVLSTIAEVDDDGFTSDGHERSSDIAARALAVTA